MRGLVSAFRDLSAAVLIVIAIIETAFRGLSAVLDPVAAGINALFGANFNGDALAAAAAILYLVGAFNLLGNAIALVKAALLAFGSAPVLVILSFAAFFAYFYQHWEEVKGLARETWGLIVALAEVAATKVIAAWTTVQKWWGDAVAALAQAWQDYFVDPILKGFDLVIYWANYFIGLVEKALSKAAELAGFGGGGGEAAALGAGAAPGFAGGGKIYGPSGRDRVPIWATAGELMVRVAAVRHYGLGFMHMINSLRLRPRFAAGGLIPALGAPRQHFATGGLVGALAPAGGAPAGLARSGFTIAIGREFFAAETDSATADRLARHANSVRARRAGIMPGWSAV